MPRIRRLLIANRGEIAVRVIRACRDVGIAPLAVYAPPDAGAPHVRLADDALPLPAEAPAGGYLDIPSLIAAARHADADALHPGYGFLAENPALAAACESARITFVGPPAEVLERCGDKAASRAAAAAAGVPILPGTGAIADAEAPRLAQAIGYPLLIKAAAGGGGKGIHLVRSPEDLQRALPLARGEARSAFGDDRVYLERWIDGPRHVEVQILAGAGGQTIHLGERSCSVQRRHQKLIEEAPAPGLSPGLRRALGEAAVAVARALGYRNAGTIEFLVDGEAFFFMEVNARIQVEHPVTEMITGVDLVAAQLAIAQGDAPPIAQDDLRQIGVAIECRISAEDPHAGFLPRTGVIDGVREPSGPGVRVDSGLWVGQVISRHFDPLLAKVITWAPARETAIARMRRALGEYAISGVDTTIPFHLWALDHPEFVAGRYDVRFADAWRQGPASDRGTRLAKLAAAAWAYRALETSALPLDGAAPAWVAAAREEGLR